MASTMEALTSLDGTKSHATNGTQATSRDGTRIGFNRIGSGPPLILVDGALCYRRMGPGEPLAKALAPHFTVLTYDRRGRGESGDTPPYSIAREIEDLEALIREAGGSASVFGVSSGAVLALEAANRLSSIKRLALYEAPFIVDDSRPLISREYWEEISQLAESGRRSEAVKQFLRAVGVPSVFVALMPLMPAWSRLKSVAHTLRYDGALVQDYQQGRPLSGARWSDVTMPTLVMDGGKSPAWMRNGTRMLAGVLPNAQYRTLPGQTHMVQAKAHAPVLTEFFTTA